MDLIAFFLVGMICGLILAVGIVLYLGKRVLQKKTQEVSSKLSISDRMKRVKEISTEQLELAMRADGPQKNSLDGKYKNSMIGRLKALEEEKNDLLRSIIADGHDPELTTMNESGVVEKMKLSEYMAYMGISMTTNKQPEQPKVSKPRTEQIGKFTVIRGGKDGGNDNSN